jgi:hypothetical protein
MKRKLAKWLIWYMVSVMLVIGITPRVYADLSPSELIGLSQIDRNSDLQKIQRVLETRLIRERLTQLGFTEEGIQGRLNQLSNEQIHQVALKIDEMKVGGDGAEVVIIILLVAVLVVAILYLTGHRVIVK